MELENKNTAEVKVENISLSETSSENLKKTAPWMKFVSIVGFVMCGLMLLAGFAMIIAGVAGGSTVLGPFAGLLYLVGAVIFFFLNRFLFFYANGVNKVYKFNENDALDTAFKMQKNYWTFMGIFLIIYLALMAIAMLAFIIGSIFQPHPF